MAKGTNKTATAPAAVMGAGGTTAPAAAILHLQVKQGCNFRGARANWYAVLLQHNGQPAAAYLATCKATPPSLPKSGVAEKPQGWLSWFLRHGVATLVAPQ